MITFDEIPYDWRKPGVYTEVKPVYDRMGLAEYPARVLLIVQKLAAGSAVAGTRYPITRPEMGKALFGAGSVGQDMVEAFKKANRTSEVWAVGIADAAAGVAATGTFTFTGTPTYGGPLPLYIGDVRIPLAITASQTVASIATAAAAAINALTDLPVTAAAVLGVVTLTAKHKGEVGNGVKLDVARRLGDSVPAGLTVAIAAMSAGATNPDVQTVLDAIANEWWTDIVAPWTDATTLSKIAADFATRYQAMGKKDAHGYFGARGAYAALATLGGSVNSPFMTIIGAKWSASSPWEWAASLAGVAAFQLTNDPARQLRSLVLPGIEAPASADGFTETEQDLLLRNGISTFNILADGTVSIDRVITTYKVSNLGVTDAAWLDVMVPKTASRIRYDWGAYFQLVYPRAKLADDNSLAAEQATPEDNSVVTPKRALGAWAARCTLYARKGWIEKHKETISRSEFVRDDTYRYRLNARQRICIIGNMMVLAGSLEFEV